jgi:predicted transcriptional regulator
MIKLLYFRFNLSIRNTQQSTMSDPSFQRVVASLQRTTHSIISADAALNRNANLLIGISSSGSRSSPLQICRDMDKCIDKGMSTIKSTKKKELKEVQDQLQMTERFVRLHGGDGGHNSYRMQATRVSEDAKSAVEGFEEACSKFSAAVSKAEKRRKVMLREEEGGERQDTSSPTTKGAVTSSSTLTEMKEIKGTVNKNRAGVNSMSNRTASSTEGDFDDDGQEVKPLLAQVSEKEKFERELHAELMRDREREVKELCDNIKDINEIFGHINELVGEQGEKLEHGISIGIEDAERRTRHRSQHLFGPTGRRP